MKETKRKKITLLGWVIGIIFMVLLFGGFMRLAPYFEVFFLNKGIATWLGVMIGFVIWYIILTAVFLVILKLGGEKLIRKE